MATFFDKEYWESIARSKSFQDAVGDVDFLKVYRDSQARPGSTDAIPPAEKVDRQVAPKDSSRRKPTVLSKDEWKKTVKDVNDYGYLGQENKKGYTSTMASSNGGADDYYKEYVDYKNTGKVKSFDDVLAEGKLAYTGRDDYAGKLTAYYRYLKGIGVDKPEAYMPKYYVAEEYENQGPSAKVFRTEGELNKFRKDNPVYAESFNQWLRKVKFADSDKRFGYDLDAANEYRSKTDPTKQVSDYMSYVSGLEDKYGRTIDRDALFRKEAGGTGGSWSIPYYTAEGADGKYFRSQSDLDSYLAERSDPKPDVGIPAPVVDDTAEKLAAAEKKAQQYYEDWTAASKDLSSLKSQFDTLFGEYSTLGSDKSALQDQYDTLFGDYQDAEGRLSDATKNYNTTVGELEKLQKQYGGLQEKYGGLQEDYSGLESDYGGLQEKYGGLQEDYGGLQEKYGGLQEDYGGLQEKYGGLQEDYGGLQEKYGGLQEDYGGLQADYGQLQTDYGLTSEQLAEALASAEDLRTRRQINLSEQFLKESEADKAARVGRAASAPTPAMSQYTSAMEGLSGTQLDPSSYSIAPIDYVSGFDPNLFTSTPLTGIMSPDAYGTTDYADIFAGPEMGMTQQTYDYGASFNPYFDEINQAYGVDLSGAYQQPRGGRR